MNLPHLVKHELKLAYLNGILLLYLGLTIVYLALLSVLLPSLHQSVAVFIVFTDPAALGMAFMGAVVLLERNQRVIPALAVSPLPVWNYMAAKIIAFDIIGTTVAVAISAFLPEQTRLVAIVGVAITSIGFSLIGMVIGVRATTLNGYMAMTMGPVVLISVPALFHLIGYLNHPLWLIHPGVASVSLIQGREVVLPTIITLCWTLILAPITHRIVTKGMRETELETV